MARRTVCLALLCVAVAIASHATVLRPPEALYMPPPLPEQPAMTTPLENAQVVGPAQNSYAIEGGEVRVAPASGPTVIFVPFQADASQYNLLRLRMKHSAGQMGALLFSDTPQIPQPGLPFHHTMIQADGQWHTYEVPLVLGQTGGWKGQLGGLTVIFPEPAEIALGLVELDRVTPRGPQAIRLANVTLKTLANLPAEWQVTPPDAAVLEAHVGVSASEGNAATLRRFLCSAIAENGAETVLVDQTVGADGSQWKPVTADLSALAGQACTIRFAIEQPEGSQAYWGAPLIRTRQTPSEARPIILISNDTLRADHLSCYGYARNTTPVLDAFAAEAVLFENAVSEEPGTLQAHMTMLTGLHPSVHRLTMQPEQHNVEQILNERFTTLAQVLAQHGYVNAGFVGVGHILNPERGFDRGFDLYSTPDSFRDILETRTLLDPWVELHADAPFLLFFHNYDIHSKVTDITTLPYYPVRPEYLHYANEFNPAPTLERPGNMDLGASRFLMAINAGQITAPTDRERDYLVALYDDGIRAVDDIHGSFFELLKQRGIYDEALIIITADHGEAFGEHGIYVHSDIYEQNAHVPLLIRFPHGEHGGRRVSELVALADLMPTILEYVGAEVPEEVTGVSLLSLLQEDELPREQVNLRLAYWDGVRTRDWKLVHNGENGSQELYHVAEDPQEFRDISQEAPEKALELAANLTTDQRRPRGGWHLRFERGDGGAQSILFEVMCSADTGIAARAIRMGDPFDRLMSAANGKGVGGSISLAARDLDEVVIEPQDPDAPLAVRIAGPTPFEVVLGDTRQTVNEWQQQLSAAKEKFVRPEPGGVEGEAVRVTVWYDLDPPQRLGGVELTPEQEEHLRSLGYVD